MEYYTYYNSEAVACHIHDIDNENNKISIYIPKYNISEIRDGNDRCFILADIHQLTQNEGLEKNVLRLYSNRKFGKIVKIIGGSGYIYTQIKIKFSSGSNITFVSCNLHNFSYELSNIEYPKNRVILNNNLIGKYVAIEFETCDPSRVKHALLLDDRLCRILEVRNMG